MNIKIIIIIGFSILYFLLEMFFNFWQKRINSPKHKGDRGSLILLTVFISIGYFLSFSAAASKTGRIYHWDAFFAGGFVFIAAGLVIRIMAISTLQQYFTYSVSTINEHRIVERGLYKSIRHPGYLGQLIIFLGLSISLSNWLSVILMMIPVTAGYVYRIIIEEKFLAEKMGDIYKNYKKRTKRLIPGIF